MTAMRIRRSEVIVVGAGPAGIAAAVQLKRSGIDPVIFEATRIGGLLRNAYWIENYPGYPKGISGDSLTRKMKRHLEHLKIRVIFDRIERVEFRRNCYSVQGTRTYETPLVVIASGTKPRLPDFDIELLGERVFFEAYPLRHVKNKTITIVGAGDAAFDYALNLGRHNRILILNRSTYPKALRLLVDRSRKGRYARSVSYRPNVFIKNIACTTERTICAVTRGRQKEDVVSDYLIFAIGREPQVDFLVADLKRMLPHGSHQLYFAGDVRHGSLRQSAVAVGDGIKVAMQIAHSVVRPAGYSMPGG